MALPWLKMVPWSTIISNAPLIVDGAKKLVALARSKPGDASGRPEPAPLSGDPRSDLAALQARIDRLEQEQRQAAELLRSMAESNAQLAQAVSALRRRAVRNMWLAWAAIAGVLLLGWWTLARF
jgi:hypothetical protein